MYSSTSETLLERVRRSDDAAWQRFVEIYSPLLLSWATRMRLPRHDALDLVQEVFALLVRKLPEFEYRRDGGFRNWLKTVAMNRWRTLAARKSLPTAATDPAEAAAPDASEEFWEKEYQQRLAQRLLQLVKDDFEPRTWEAFWENVILDRSAAETAQKLGVRPAFVHSARHRVLKRLRQELGELEG